MKKFFRTHEDEIHKITECLNRFSLLFHGILACMICFFAEWVSRHSLLKAASFVWDSPMTFLYNVMIVFVTFLPVYFFKRRALVRVVISFIWCALGIVNGCVLAERVTPFGFTDLKLINDLFSMKSSYFTPAMCIAAILVVGLFVTACVYLYKKGPVFRGRMHRRIMVLILASCYLWVPMITNAAVQSEVITDYFDNIAQGYERYGFVYGFSSSVVDRGMEEPKGYSEEAVEAIMTEVSANMIADQKYYSGDSYVSAVSGQISDTVSANSVRVIPANPRDPETPNIILVLLESFVDPEEIGFLELSEDPVPNFHYLEKNYSSGYLSVPVVGAGTANTEFEVLTGMSMRFFGTGEYPYKTVLKTNTCESVAAVLSDMGYGTFAVHNNKAKFYSRDNAFSKMGFDTFVSREFMNIREWTPLETWPTDDILRRQVLACLDDTPGQSDFVYTITVQGHGAYPTEQVLQNPQIGVSANGLEPEQNYQWEYYVNEIHEVDRFIGDLVNDLGRRNEKTMVIMFGDHLPTMDLQNENMESGDIFKTKYITWNNYGLPKEDADITAYQLVAHMLNQTGIHEGTLLSYHQSVNADLASEEDETYLSGLEMLQYDILYGERYAYEGKDIYPESELELGLEDAVIENVRTEGEQLVVTGEGFTPWSVVYVNGEPVETTQYADGCLTVSLEEYTPETGDEIVVSQCSGETVFRSSNMIIY